MRYRVQATNDRRNLVFPFYVIPREVEPMSLPVPNLDDRTFQDLVDEAKRLIPTYCPEWTNHNLTDPGVALIELFAWMTELSLFRLNQVPDTFYTHMLNMMGFEPFPATAARTDLTFWLVDVVDEPVVVPAGTQVSTAGDVGAPRVFTTLADLVDHPARADGRARVARARRLRRRVGRAAPAQPGRRLLPAHADDARRPLLPRLRAVAGRQRHPHDDRRQRRGHRRHPDQAAAALGGLAGRGLDPGTVYRDTTGGLNRDGQITLLVPPAHEPLTLGGQRAYWMRARVLEPEPGQPTYRASPQIRQIRVDSIGGSVTAEHSDGAPREVLGTSTGKPDQRFATRAHAGAAAQPRRDRSRSSTATSTTEWDGGARLRRQRARRPPLRVELDDRRGPLRAADPLPRRHAAASTARCPARAR